MPAQQAAVGLVTRRWAAALRQLQNSAGLKYQAFAGLNSPARSSGAPTRWTQASRGAARPDHHRQPQARLVGAYGQGTPDSGAVHQTPTTHMP